MKLPHLRSFWALLFLASAAAATAENPAPVIVPRFSHPGAGQVFYFVLTDRFANGNPANDTGGIAGGPEMSGFDPTRIGYYHGGDFAGLTAKLDYLKNLGVTAVWVTPPFRNKPMQLGSAGYHGYWILDFLHIDPHLGTDAEFNEFVHQAHARGLKVYLDIVVNHTADVIQYQGGRTDYISTRTAPYRDANGRPFDEHAAAYNGVNPADAFPTLSPTRSFPYVPVIAAAEANAKNPAWLNNPVYYHNRGNSSFTGESSTLGDFGGLDDLFTEQPAVVRGFIDIYRHWIDDFGADGFRIDTVKHVNLEFWQAFAPAIREAAGRAGKPDFLQFGEVANESYDIPLLSEFSTSGQLEAALDFGFFRAARAYVSELHSGAELADFFALDDYYTDHDHNVQAATTFLGNHDAGRFAYFLQRDNPDASPAQLAQLVELGHGLLFLARGQPVVYYGDEQGMIGRGGDDMQAREDMFAAQAPDFKNAALLGTTRTGADDKFDKHHPFYRMFHELAALRTSHPALSRGAMITRPTGESALFAFSRFERSELVEYLAVFNNSRTATLSSAVPTSQPAGATLKLLYASPAASVTTTLAADSRGRVAVTLGPLQFALWQAASALPAPSGPIAVKLTRPAAGSVLAVPAREVDGQILPIRPEIRAEVTGGDGVAEVTFAMERKSRPGQYELLGVDDAPPYRIFWRPPPDLAPGEELSFIASVDNLRGGRAVARLDGFTVAAGTPAWGIRGSAVPRLTGRPGAAVIIDFGAPLMLAARAEGSGPLHYQWLRDGVEIPGATEDTLSFPHASAALSGHYRVMVRGLSGTVLGSETTVTVTPATAGRIETLPPIASHFVAPRRVDVWLPPGYDAHSTARYPVIYMQDGQNLFDPLISFGGVSWEVDQTLCRLIQAGRTPGAIIVGIWNTGMGRFADYMPQKAVTTEVVAHYAGGPKLSVADLDSDAYLKYLVTELKPVIDRAYRTEPDQAHTFAMGSSMGGLISAYALCEYPDVFGGAGCISTHWPAGDGAVIDYLAKHLPSPATHRFYFDYGTATLDAQYEPFQQRMDAVMRAAGYTEGRNWTTRKFPGAEHSEKSWRQRVDVPLRFLLAK
jgi:glycosidase/predicted alpha/beta superfamily hydrolase